MSDPLPRSPLSAGLEWASRISALGLEFGLPAFAGHFVDRKLGTSPWLLLTGMALGFAAGMVHILRIARGPSKPGSR